jgi:ParB family chromosome partitioning protein
MRKRANYKGLAALQIVKPDGQAGDMHPVRQFMTREGFLYVAVDFIRPNPDQPRKHFDKAAIEELTASVREKGVLQPILVRQDPAQNEHFLIIAGERRWRAAKAAGLEEIPTFVRPSEDALEVALIENVQREDLNPIEEAEAFLRLKEARGFTDEQLAKVVGKSRVSVTESLSLNQLPEAVKAECRTSDNWSKSQLLQVLRAGSPEKVQDAWKAAERGDVTTVRALREHKHQQKKAALGRPKHYRFEYAPKGKFHLTLTFPKKTATRADVRGALKDALKHLP